MRSLQKLWFTIYHDLETYCFASYLGHDTNEAALQIKKALSEIEGAHGVTLDTNTIESFEKMLGHINAEELSSTQLEVMDVRITSMQNSKGKVL